MTITMRKCNSLIMDIIRRQPLRRRQLQWTCQRTLYIGMLLVIINSIISPCDAQEASESRSIDLASSWRPMHFQQPAPPSHLISISSMDNANRMQLFQIAQYNAQILQRLKDMEAALKRNNIDIHGVKPTTKTPAAATPTVLPEYSLNQIAQLRSNHNALRNSIDPAMLMGEPSHTIPATLKQSPQFYHNPSFLKPPFNIHSAASNVVFSALPQSQAVPKSNSFGQGKPVYYNKYPEAKPQYYSSTPKIPYMIQQSPPHISPHSSFYRTATVYRDAPITTPPHPVLNKIHAHINSYVGHLPPQRHHSNGIVPINGQQHVKIGNASIPMHIISSLSIFGNALQQIRDTTQKETILNHLLRNITTTAATYIPPSVATTLASVQVNPFSTLPPPDAYFKPMHFKPIPVTMAPQPTDKSPAEMESQPTMAFPQRPVYPPIPEIITERPTMSPANKYMYGMGSVKQLPFLPTIPAPSDKPPKQQRVKIISPLQDANRFAYKTNTPAAVSNSYDNQLFTVTPGKPISYSIGSTTENTFHIFDNHLNTEFKKIKQQYQNKPAKKQNLRIIGDSMTTQRTTTLDSHNNPNPNHSFFTIEDAVTGVPHHYIKSRPKPVKPHRHKENGVYPTQMIDIMSTISNLDYYRTMTTSQPPVLETTQSPTTTTTTTTTTPAPPTTVQDVYDIPFPTQAAPTHIPRQRTKLRRKKPRPHFVNQEQEMDTATSNVITNSWEYTRSHRHRVRGRPSADMEVVDEVGVTEANVIENAVTDQATTRLRERVKFPARHRFAESTTAEPRTRETIAPLETLEKENLVEEVLLTTAIPVTTTPAGAEEDHTRPRTRFRYKLRSRPTLQTTTTSTTESPINEEQNFEESTENPMVDNEEKMILNLMNNVGKGGALTTEDTLTTLSPLQSRIKPIIKFDTKNRPRFSVKDYRNRQNGTTTTKAAEPSSTTPSSNFRTRNKYTKDELENRATKRLSTSVPRRKPLGNRLDLNKLRTSSEATTSAETTPGSQSVPNTTPMTIKLRNSFRNKSRFGANANEKVTTPNENDIPQTDEVDELVRSESNHYGKEAEAEESTIVEKVTEKSHETSIMKIAKDDHSYRSHIQRSSTTPSALAELMNTIDSESNLLQRVSDLTVTSGHNFANSVNTKHVSRKIPNYFTIATEDPILPLEAFFPNVINKE